MLCYNVPNSDKLSREELRTVTSFAFLLFMGSAGLSRIDDVIASWWQMRAALVFSPGLLMPEGIAYLDGLLTVDFVRRLQASGWHTNDSAETDVNVWRARLIKRDAAELVRAVPEERREAVVSYFGRTSVLKQRAKRYVTCGKRRPRGLRLGRAVDDLRKAFDLK